jgi:hypothetical protein
MMKHTVVLFVLGLFLSLLTACDRKPLYLLDETAVSVTVVSYASIDELWGASWRDSLLYEWDEKSYGTIGYTLPKTTESYIISEDSVSHEGAFYVDGRHNLCNMDMYTPYKLLLHTADHGLITDDISGEDATIQLSEMLKKTTAQSGEIFRAYNPDIFITEEDIVTEQFIDGVWTSVYNIRMYMQPVSWIYIIQFVIKDDIDNPEVMSVDEIHITGMSSGVELYQKKKLPYDSNLLLCTDDIKPFQTIRNHNISACRVTTFGAAEYESGSSWSSDRPDNIADISVTSRQLGPVTIQTDLSPQFIRRPYGGIITVYIDGTKLVDEVKNGWWKIDVTEWNDIIRDIII